MLNNPFREVCIKVKLVQVVRNSSPPVFKQFVKLIIITCNDRLLKQSGCSILRQNNNTNTSQEEQTPFTNYPTKYLHVCKRFLEAPV